MFGFGFSLDVWTFFGFLRIGFDTVFVSTSDVKVIGATHSHNRINALFFIYGIYLGCSRLTKICKEIILLSLKCSLRLLFKRLLSE